MARLNEPPAVAPASSSTAGESVDARKYSCPTEYRIIKLAMMRTKSKLIVQRPPADFDEVKRRFIRQNRELAKNNSNQSLRIRNLEIEVSRLLAGNLDLREQVFQLQNELFSARAEQVSGGAVQRVKAELQAKVAELCVMLDGMDGMDGLAQTGGDDVLGATHEKKPIEGQWRERQPLTEAMRETAMPTITEDKLYPRRTLGADEIQAIRLSDHSSNESPDLGPPPIAHFDYEDPVKQPSPSASRVSPNTAEEEDLPAPLSVNLETRRRRKDGQPRIEIRRHSILSQSPDKRDVESSTMLRTGAKRKLADRDIDKPIKPPAKDDFTFSRRTNVSDGKAGPRPGITHAEGDPSERPVDVSHDVASASPRPLRKVLGDKSVNMSPRKAVTAPEKAGKVAPEKVNKLGKPAVSRPASVTARKRRVSAIPQPSPPDNILDTIELAPPPEPKVSAPPPKTPAPDLFSPTPSEPSAARPEEGRAGTPPPGDLSTLSTTTDGGSRPSRRARAAVSYAEPSLMTKMRRPGKQMVDALSGLQDPRRGMSASTEDKARPVMIKQEPGEDEDAWRSLPAAIEPAAASPLEVKSAERSSNSALPVDDAEVEHENEQPPSAIPSAASATISALMAGSRKRRESAQQQPLGIGLADAMKRMEDLDVYDFKDSSSPADGIDDKPGESVRSRSHRRHSSVPKDVGAVGNMREVTAKAMPSMADLGMGRAERAASRRRSMML